MRSWIIGPALLLAGLTAASPAGAIVGGQAASQPYPHMAALLYSEGIDDHDFLCGASLLRQDWILTAAHCVRHDRDGDGTKEVVPAESLRFLFGTARRTAGGEIIQADQVLVHENAGAPDTYSNDVALVHLERPASQATPIALASPAERELWAAGRQSRVIGWGGTFYPGIYDVNTTDDLQEIDVPLVDDESCATAYPISLPVQNAFDATSMVCAGELHGTRDACSGDSGGPLMVPGASGAMVLVGIVSWGRACAAPGSYGVYARVGDGVLRSWLDRHLPPDAATRAPALSMPASGEAPDAKPHAGAAEKEAQPAQLRGRMLIKFLGDRRVRVRCALDGVPLRRCTVTGGGRTITLRRGASGILRFKKRSMRLRAIITARDGRQAVVTRKLQP
jgi:secreted trypsin-like serine protease